MSRENVEALRAGFAAWNAGDMEAVRELYHPEAIVRPPENWPEPGPFVGRDAIMRQFEDLRATYDADSLEVISDFSDVADRVVLRCRWHGVGQGPDPAMEFTLVYTMRGGRVFELEYFWDHAEALAAVGLRDG
jgi:ketosteroid isomerase-like protein